MRQRTHVVMSERDRLAVRERQEYERAEAEKVRLAEDHQQHATYLKTYEVEQRGLPPAYRVEPLSFEDFRSAMPEAETDPELRAAIAINKALQYKAVQVTLDQVENGKDDDVYIDPETVGPEHSMTEDAAAAYNAEQAKLFVRENLWWYGSAANKTALLTYLDRNGIQIANAEMLCRAALKLQEYGLLEQRPAKQEPSPELNRYGVNLGIESNPALERERQRLDYITQIVITDPRTGEGLTAYQLDRLPSEEFRRIRFGDFGVPTFRNAIPREWVDTRVSEISVDAPSKRAVAASAA
jgi:hypothetical protein